MRGSSASDKRGVKVEGAVSSGSLDFLKMKYSTAMALPAEAAKPNNCMSAATSAEMIPYTP